MLRHLFLLVPNSIHFNNSVLYFEQLKNQNMKWYEIIIGIPVMLICIYIGIKMRKYCKK